MSAKPLMPTQSDIAVQALVELLAPALGEDVAMQTITRACEIADVTAAEMSRANALKVLDVVADQPGLVGITGRFAKSRVLLQWKA